MNETGNAVANDKEVLSETDIEPDAEPKIPYSKSEMLFVLGLIEALRTKNNYT